MPKINIGTEFTDEFKDHIEGLVCYFLRYICAHEYAYQIKYEDHCCDDDDGTRATVSVDSVYLRATFRINKSVLELWKANDFDQVAKIVCHEVSHILLDPLNTMATGMFARNMRDHWIDTLERQNCRLTNVIMLAFPDENHFSTENVKLMLQREKARRLNAAGN